MSNTETHNGKLRKVDLAGLTVEKWAEAKCNELGVTEREKWYDTWFEQLADSAEKERKYFKVKDEVWELFDHLKFDDYEDINMFLPQPDGTILFVTQFYNGGTCLSEIVEEEIANVQNSTSTT